MQKYRIHQLLLSHYHYYSLAFSEKQQVKAESWSLMEEEDESHKLTTQPEHQLICVGNHLLAIELAA